MRSENIPHQSEKVQVQAKQDLQVAPDFVFSLGQKSVIVQFNRCYGATAQDKTKCNFGTPSVNS